MTEVLPNPHFFGVFSKDYTHVKLAAVNRGEKGAVVENSWSCPYTKG